MKFILCSLLSEFHFLLWKKKQIFCKPALRGRLFVRRAVAPNKANRQFHGIAYRNFDRLDGYVRERIRTALSNRGRKHGNRTQAKLLHVKYGVEFFIKDMGLVNGEYMRLTANGFLNSIDDYLAYRTAQKAKRKRPLNAARIRALNYAYAK